jgi:hypothetical protein
MNYNLWNNITGWGVFIIATIVYALTLEPTSSYWDCGEFISCSYKLMIPHPPGAPFFLLIGRLFSMFTSDPLQVAKMVNMVSALSSAFTSLFLFWSITLLGKKIVKSATPDFGQTLKILGAGIVGSLAYTFTDSAWFSAVEAEVYAMSSFFTAFVFWAILKWDARSHERDSDKWIILIAYMMGLSIGVHLLNLVAIPALAFVIYFKRKDIDAKGVILTLVISSLILGVILVGIIPGLPTVAGWFELYFVNDLGLDFNSGSIFFIILLVAILAYGIYYSHSINSRTLNTALLSLAFILIGYSSYEIILVRTGFNPPIDMNDPGDVMTFTSYLKREQYGDRPLLKGPYYYARPIDYKEGAKLWRKGDKKYIHYGNKYEYIYRDRDMTLFPRMYSDQPHHVQAYRSWMNIPPNRKPTMGDNLGFLFKYQIGHMYLRYFMWNFAGREHDFQNADWLGPADWFKDKEDLPHNIATNKARNNFYMLPLLLGLLGAYYHFSKHQRDASIVGMLFFFTGIAIVLYLNQPPVEPRERDYTFAGSFWAFSIWIGIGVFMIADALEKITKSQVNASVIAILIGLLVPGILAAEGWDDHDRSDRYHSVDSAKNLLNSCAPNAILFTGGDNDTYPLWYAQEVEGFRTDVRVCNLSLLNTDWYIQQMMRKAYDSEPLPMSLPMSIYLQGTNDRVPVMKSEQALNLREFIKLAAANSNAVKAETRGGERVLYLASQLLQLDIDKEKLMNNPAIPEKLKPFIQDKMIWKVTNGEGVDKKSLAILDMIATNNWERPIYFSTTVGPSDFLNLKEFTQQEGMTYRLLPVKVPGATQGWINTDIMYENLMKNSFWRNLDRPDVYYNEWYYTFTSSERLHFYTLAQQLVREGQNEKAKEAILFSLKVMPDSSLPYDQSVANYISILYQVGEKQKAEEIINIMAPRLEKSLEYAAKQKEVRDLQDNLIIAQEIYQALREEGKTEEALKYQEMFEKYLEIFNKLRQGH